MVGAVPAGAQTVDEGRQVYESSCQACHQPGGVGVPGSFPPLVDNPAVEDDEYVAEVIRNGLAGELTVLGETYNGLMPALPQLTDGQIAAVIAYLGSLAAAPPDTATTTTLVSTVVGDAARGEELFTGSARLSAGGPACAACHPAGAGLGPDLGGAFTRLGGEAGLRGWLAAPPSPTMQPIFSSQPMTDSEIADVTAHLATLEGASPAGAAAWFPLAGLGGLVVLIGFMALVIGGPTTTYADRLRSEA